MTSALICAVFALSSATAVIALTLAPASSAPTAISELMSSIQSGPTDMNAQVQACQSLDEMSQNREGEKPGPFGGVSIPIHLLEAGYGEVAAVALSNIMAKKNPDTASKFEAASRCFSTINGMTVQYNQPKMMACYRNSPHLWAAVVDYYKEFWHQRKSLMNLCFFAGFYGSNDEIATGLEQAGGFEFLLDAMDQTFQDPQVFQQSLCSISDHVQGSEVANKALLKHGAVQHLLNAVRAAHPLKNFIEGNGFSLKYEVLEDIVGLLKHDGDRKVANAFVEAGLIEAVITMMPDDSNDLYFQDHCCQTMNWLANGSPEVQSKLAEGLAPGLVEKATSMDCLPACSWPPPVVNEGGAFAGRLTKTSAPPSCVYLQKNLKRSPGSWQPWQGEGGGLR